MATQNFRILDRLFFKNWGFLPSTNYLDHIHIEKTPVPDPDNLDCTLGEFICGGGGFGDGGGVGSGNGTGNTGVGTTNTTNGGIPIVPFSQIVPDTPFDQSSINNIIKRGDLADLGNIRASIQIFLTEGMTITANGFSFKAGGWGAFKDYVSSIGKQVLIEYSYREKWISPASRDFLSKLIDMASESSVEPFIRLYGNTPGVGNGGTDLANLFDKTSVGQFMAEHAHRTVGGDAPATNDLSNAVVNSLRNNGAREIERNGGWSSWLKKMWSGN